MLTGWLQNTIHMKEQLKMFCKELEKFSVDVTCGLDNGKLITEHYSYFLENIALAEASAMIYLGLVQCCQSSRDVDFILNKYQKKTSMGIEIWISYGLFHRASLHRPSLFVSVCPILQDFTSSQQFW
jgi:hypothetical protein